MSLLSTLFGSSPAGAAGEAAGGAVSGIASAVQKIVGTFKLSPEAQLEFNAKLEENKFELAKMDMDLEGKLQDIAGQNIRSETGSEDKFTSRARPGFMYLIMFILLCNYVVFPFLKHPVIELPQGLLWLFGSAIMGYTGARSLDKMMGLPGDSQVQLPLGIKLGNKS